MSNSRIVKVPRENSNDFNPMWAGDKVYFLSDRDGPATLFSYDPKTVQVKKLVDNRGLDFKSAGAGADAIVLEQFGALSLYDLKRAAPAGRVEVSADCGASTPDDGRQQTITHAAIFADWAERCSRRWRDPSLPPTRRSAQPTKLRVWDANPCVTRW